MEDIQFRGPSTTTSGYEEQTWVYCEIIWEYVVWLTNGRLGFSKACCSVGFAEVVTFLRGK